MSEHYDVIIIGARTGGGTLACKLAPSGKRMPATLDIGLDDVGLEPGRPVRVHGRLRAGGVSGGWLYAIGDCNGLAALTHMGKHRARIAADAILGKRVADLASDSVVPRIVFTDPQVCAVGHTEATARTAGLDVTVVRTATGDVPGAYTQGVGIGGTSQLVIDDSRRTVAGATFTGPGVQELLHSATVAIFGGVPVDRLWPSLAVVPDHQRGLASPTRGLRPVRRS